MTFSQTTESGGTAPLSYSWNFGDGTTASGSLTPSHTYANPGSYTASVTVTDANKLTSTSSVVVTVDDVAPTVSFTDPRAAAGSPVSFTASATDVSPAVQAAGFTYAWTFGDGSTGTGATPTHTYATSGTYTVTVTAKDEYGKTGTGSGTITIYTPPAVSSETPVSGATGVAVSSPLTARFNEAVQAGTIAFTITPSGGAAVAGTVSYNSTTNTATFTPSSPLTYNTTYTATVSGAQDTAGDSMNGTFSWSFTTPWRRLFMSLPQETTAMPEPSSLLG